MKLRGCITMDIYKDNVFGDGAAVLKIANATRYGRVAFAVLCDGPEDEEVEGEAATIAAEYFAKWFLNELPQILEEAESNMVSANMHGMKARVITEVLCCEDRTLSYSTRVFHAAKEVIKERLKQLAMEVNIRIAGRGRLTGRNMKAVAQMLLVMGGEYILMRVGSPVAYKSDRETLHEISGSYHGADLRQSDYFGKMEMIKPVFVEGQMEKGTGFLLCSSHFARLQDRKYLQKRLRRVSTYSERKMDRVLRSMTRTVRKKGETKDVYAICVTCTG